MKAFASRLEKLEKAKMPLVDQWEQTLLETLERGRQRLQAAGYPRPVSRPAAATAYASVWHRHGSRWKRAS